MKTNKIQSRTRLVDTFKKILPAAIVALTLPATAQVVIEAGPDAGAVQLSDGDGGAEAGEAGSSIDTPAATSTSAIIPKAADIERDGSTTIRTNQLESTTVSIPSAVEARTPIADINPASKTVSVQTGPTMTPALAKRLAEIERKLAIRDNGTRAAVAVTTEGLFAEGTNTIDTLSKAHLEEIAEYIKLSPKDQVDLTYHYVADDESENTAWMRSLSLVEWMKSEGQLSQASFRLNEPTPAERVPDHTNPQSVQDTELIGWIEIAMQ